MLYLYTTFQAIKQQLYIYATLKLTSFAFFADVKTMPITFPYAYGTPSLLESQFPRNTDRMVADVGIKSVILLLSA